MALSANYILPTVKFDGDSVVSINQGDYNKWQRTRDPTNGNFMRRKRIPVSDETEPVGQKENRIQSKDMKSPGNVKQHSCTHHQVTPNAFEGEQTQDVSTEVNVLNLLIKSRLKALQNYRAREEVLLLENEKMRKEIEKQEKDVHGEVTCLLQKYERYRGAISTLTTKFEKEKALANRQFEEAKLHTEQEIKVLDAQVKNADIKLKEKRQQLKMLLSYKDREYPVHAVHIAQLQLQIDTLKKQHKRENIELKRIIKMETEKYQQNQTKDIQDIKEDAINNVMDTLQDGLKEMALQNITMKKEMEEHSEETANIIKMIPCLEKDIKDLKLDPKSDLRRQMFPHLFQEVTKCTPDMDVVLDIPVNQDMQI